MNTFDWVWFLDWNLHFIRDFLDDLVRLWNFDGVFLDFLNLDWVLLDNIIGLWNVIFHLIWDLIQKL